MHNYLLLGFNEAAALKPRKLDGYRKRITEILRGFNEAAALKPRKPHHYQSSLFSPEKLQ